MEDEGSWPPIGKDFVFGPGHLMHWGERIDDDHWGIWSVLTGRLLAASPSKVAIEAAARLFRQPTKADPVTVGKVLEKHGLMAVLDEASAFLASKGVSR